MLFLGTLRFNLDPFDTCTDDEIWRALKNAYLSDFVEKLSKGLKYSIAEGGENLRCDYIIALIISYISLVLVSVS